MKLVPVLLLMLLVGCNRGPTGPDKATQARIRALEMSENTLRIERDALIERIEKCNAHVQQIISDLKNPPPTPGRYH